MKPSSPLFRATYRLQLRKTFPFKAASAVTPYLDEMGISHLYLSPILESSADSNHGYDAVDPTKISEERGGEKGFDLLMAQIAKQKTMQGAILDIVPNHVAASLANPGWWDVLKFGEKSKFYGFFDFRARANGDKRIVLPVLGKKLRSVLASKELYLAKKDGELTFKYWDKHFPIDPKTVSKDLEELSPKDLKALSIKAVESLLAKQAYALEDWKAGSREVNYRRFFDINDLAAIRVERDEVFEWDHSKVNELLKKYPIIHGLRVDHVDGLTDPETYLKKLATLSPNVWVEKILGDGEKMPESWPINGTTGYEFSNSSARLFVDLPGLQHLHSHYTRHVDRRWERFHECVYDSKREMLETHFVSELSYLVDEFHRLSASDRKNADFSKEELNLALVELTASLRIYRTYAKKGQAIDSKFLNAALAEAEGRGRITTSQAFEWLRAMLLGPGDWSDEIYALIKRWEQLSGPVMAKGLEDTALYRYFPHLSLNGVGGEPDWTGDGAIEFHAANKEKHRSEPRTLNASSTHDTKRSEDVRSRLHVVSELSEEWSSLFDKIHIEDTDIDSSTQYLIFETLVGAWPLDGKITPDFISRMNQYFLKAVREAKSATSWSEPDERYEKSLEKFVVDFLKPKSPKAKKDFERLEAFAEKCSFYGAFNSLSFLALKSCSPGVPDFYQGTELWDLSLVDPDNRRPVDYDLRKSMLKQIKADRKNGLGVLKKRALGKWRTGEIKLWLTYELLQLRLKHPEVFIEGEYYPLDPSGEGRRHFVSFLRHHHGKWALIVVPRFLASENEQKKSKTFDSKQALGIKSSKILNVKFDVPAQAPNRWTSVLTGTELSGQSFTAAELLEGLPIAVFTAN